MNTKDMKLESLLISLENGSDASKEDIRYLLGLDRPDQIQQLFQAARQVRAQYFGNRIFLYGFLYFSTFCRNNCRFCHYRNANTQLSRYRKTRDQILTAAREMADIGVHLIDLTMGEDPVLYETGTTGLEDFSAMVQAVQTETGLPVMVSPGILADEGLQQLAATGVEWYACYQETHNRTLYSDLRQGQDFDQRMAKKQLAKASGMLIEEGLLTGVGETLDDLADSIVQMQELAVDQARVMTFVPQANTPMVDIPPQGSLKEQQVIAVMRLALPDRLIPASLDVDGLDGLKARLDAGANVVTSIVPPEKGLAGVANHSLDIEDSRRNLDHILPILEACGLEAASSRAYRDWVSERMVLTNGVGECKIGRSSDADKTEREKHFALSG